MAKAPDLAYAIGLPPKQAIEYFQSLGYRVSRNAVQAYNAAQARAFTVTGITRMDVLQDVKSGLDKALEKGTTLAEFQRDTQELLRRRGWVATPGGAHANPGTGEVVATLPPRRMQTIFRTNTQSALMAGRYQQLMDDVDIAPYWQYVAVMDNRTRPSHAALNGLIFRHDDPFWDSHFPPCGFNCRCSVRALRLRDIERRGLIVADSVGMLEPTEVMVGREKRPGVAFVDKATRVRVVADPGFGRRPVLAQQSLGEVLGQRIVQSPPGIGAVVVASMPGLAAPLTQEYVSWARKVLKAGQAAGAYRVVATLAPKTVKQLQKTQASISTAAVILHDRQLLDLDRDARRARHVALSRTQLLALPELLLGARAVLLDQESSTLIYVLATGGDGATRSTVRVRLGVNTDAGIFSAPKVTAAAVLSVQQLRSDRYVLLDGTLD